MPGAKGRWSWLPPETMAQRPSSTPPLTPIPWSSALADRTTTASAYPNARKLARDAQGTLHQVWHARSGDQYQILYATSGDGGATWQIPQVVFNSSAESYSPSLAIDGNSAYIVFASKAGAASYQ